MVQESRSDDPDLLKLDKPDQWRSLGLAAAVIKSANSPFYGLNHKVMAVKSALQVLGIRSVTSIVTLLALRNALNVPGQANDPFWDQFWDRTNYHAIACARLARQLRFISTDGAFTFGLFNDCGIPVLVQRFGDYRETLRLSASTGRPLIELEYERHQATHAIIGSILASSWHLPDLVSNAIRDHHNFALLYGETPAGQGDVAALAAISLIADYLVNDFLGTPAGAGMAAAWCAGRSITSGLTRTNCSKARPIFLRSCWKQQAYRK